MPSVPRYAMTSWALCLLVLTPAFTVQAQTLGSTEAEEKPVTAEEPAPTGEQVYSEPEDEEESRELLDTVDVERELLRFYEAPTPKNEQPKQQPTGETGRLSAPATLDFFVGSNFQLRRFVASQYEDGIDDLATFGRKSPREISNLVCGQSVLIDSAKRASDMVWQWGQFLDHDVDLTEPDEQNPEHEDIAVPLGDPFFDPQGNGGVVIPFTRSKFDPATGTGTANPRQQVNEITDFVDATNVYGSDAVRTAALRTNDGTGRLKTSAGSLLPFNTFGLPNAGGANRTDLFLAGDIRANEQMGLAAMHTLWVREHNYWAGRLNFFFPWLSGNQVFQAAREIVRFEAQIVTYKEFLPVILGPNPLPPYGGYDSNLDPRIANVFSTAGYRLGHTMLSPVIRRQDKHGNTVPQGDLALRDAFFDPPRLIETNVAPFMKGLSNQIMQRIDNLVVDDVRNFLFGPPGAGGLDLASLNIQRGRDHGLPDYNTVRLAYGLTPAVNFSDINPDPAVYNRLSPAYTGINDVDPWVGALSEPPLGGGILVGPLLQAILVEQFYRLREGDPNWYQNRLSPLAAFLLHNQTTLAKIVARNTTLKRGHLNGNVFVVP
jgi:peroxidase